MRDRIDEQQVLDDMRRDERQQIEFKEGFVKTGDLAEQIMAFANAEGGTIYLGIADQPQPSGKIQQVTKAEHDNVHRAARDLLVPPVVGVTAHEVEVQGEMVLAIAVPRTGDLHQHRNGRILIRRGSENVALLGDALRQALLEREQPSFDDRPVWEATLDDLDLARVEWYLRRASQERGLPADPSLPLEQNLVRLGAVIRDEERLVPRVAGLLLFGRAPQQFVPQSRG